jgi:hypothetical protein
MGLVSGRGEAVGSARAPGPRGWPGGPGVSGPPPAETSVSDSSLHGNSLRPGASIPSARSSHRHPRSMTATATPYSMGERWILDDHLPRRVSLASNSQVGRETIHITRSIRNETGRRLLWRFREPTGRFLRPTAWPLGAGCLEPLVSVESSNQHADNPSRSRFGSCQ